MYNLNHQHGTYTIHDKDGRKRIVEYVSVWESLVVYKLVTWTGCRHTPKVADKKGFRAKIHSNEPGLASHHAAHAKYDVEHHGYHGGHDDHGYGHGGGHHGGGHYKHDEGGDEY